MAKPTPPVRRDRTITLIYRRPIIQGEHAIHRSVCYGPTPEEVVRHLADLVDRPACALQVADCGLDPLDELGRERAELRLGVNLAEAGPVFGDCWGFKAGELGAAVRAVAGRRMAA